MVGRLEEVTRSTNSKISKYQRLTESSNAGVDTYVINNSVLLRNKPVRQYSGDRLIYALVKSQMTWGGGVLRCPDAKPLGINPERLVVEPRVANDPHGRPGVEGEWKDNLEF